MNDRVDFETRLEGRLRARAAIASRPFDAGQIARQAVAIGARRRKLGRLSWPARPTIGWLPVALLFALMLVGAITLVGTLLREPAPRPLPASNGLIAIAANPDGVVGEVGDIYVVAEGAVARRIIGSDDDGIAQACPRFSPDGRRLAYAEGRASEVGLVADRAVVVVGVNDQGEASPPIKRVILPKEAGEISCPVEWSPSGGQVAFRVGPELWVTDATSGTSTVFSVTEWPWGGQGFEWSRDGSRIAVSEPGQIRVVPINGGASILIPVTGGSPESLGWTAGDDRIVYVLTEEPDRGLAGHVVGADGRNDILLTSDGTDIAVSPDGTRVAFAHQDPESQGVTTMGIDGSDVVELPVPSGFPFYRESRLQWSPDGQRLLFGFTAGVVSVAVAPGSPAVIHSRAELNLEWSNGEFTWQPVVP